MPAIPALFLTLFILEAPLGLDSGLGSKGLAAGALPRQKTQATGKCLDSCYWQYTVETSRN